jgi:hypothetical protein
MKTLKALLGTLARALDTLRELDDRTALRPVPVPVRK